MVRWDTSDDTSCSCSCFYQRGSNYASFSLDFPSRLKVVGVAEPLEHRRRKYRELYRWGRSSEYQQEHE